MQPVYNEDPGIILIGCDIHECWLGGQVIAHCARFAL